MLALLVVLCSTAHSFSLVRSTVSRSLSQKTTGVSPNVAFSVALQSSEDSNIEATASNEVKDVIAGKSSAEPEMRRVTRTILLAVPLFCKFVIVLAIKFMTDLVVFPLLYLYRLARLTRKRIAKAFMPKDDTINGQSGGNAAL